MGLLNRVGRALVGQGPGLVRGALAQRSTSRPQRRPPGGARHRDPAAGAPPRDSAAGGQHRDTAAHARHLEYAPDLDGQADPGEVVWTWVPFEEDASQGKDRPVLVVGRDGGQLLGLMLSSRDHGDSRSWLALGRGAWDSQDRDSWVRLDRVLLVAEDGIRREGAILARDRFDLVAGRLRAGYGWSG